MPTFRQAQPSETAQFVIALGAVFAHDYVQPVWRVQLCRQGVREPGINVHCTPVEPWIKSGRASAVVIVKKNKDVLGSFNIMVENWTGKWRATTTRAGGYLKLPVRSVRLAGRPNEEVLWQEGREALVAYLLVCERLRGEVRTRLPEMPLGMWEHIIGFLHVGSLGQPRWSPEQRGGMESFMGIDSALSAKTLFGC